MAADSITTALLALPDGADPLTTALAGAAAGARVFPVMRRNEAYMPVDLPMGAGRSAWEGATRDPGKLRRLFANNPGATAAFVDRTEAGLRARIWSGGRLTAIPTIYAKG